MTLRSMAARYGTAVLLATACLALSAGPASTDAGSVDLAAALSGDATATGGDGTYKVTAANLGPGTATTVRLILKVPKASGFALQERGSSGGCVQQPDDPARTFRKFTCEAGPIGPNASAAATYRLTDGIGGRYTLVGKVKPVTLGQADPNPSNNRATLDVSVEDRRE